MIEKTMQKKASQIFSFLLSPLFLFFVGKTYAASGIGVANSTLCPSGQFANLCNLTINQSGTFVGGIIAILLIAAIVAAVIFFIYGGIRWIMSGGDKGKIDQARGMITASIVGLIIALFAYFVLNTITFIITGQRFSSYTIPTLVP